MAKSARSLGRPLDANRYTLGQSTNLPQLVEVKLDQLKPNPYQPRKQFLETEIEELAQSIKKHTLLQPIVIVPDKEITGTENIFVIAAGERRVRACQILGWITIPAILIRTGNIDELALIENLQREDLAPLDVAEALAALMDRYGYTQQVLGETMGKGRRTVNEVLMLNKLPDKIKEECRTFGNRISKSLLLEIARLREENMQLRLWERIKSGQIFSKREAELQRKERSIEKLKMYTPYRTLQSGRSFIDRLKAIDVDKIKAEDYSELVTLQEEIARYIEALKVELPPR